MGFPSILISTLIREGYDLFLLFTSPQRASPPPTYKKLTAITGRASSLLNGSVGVFGVCAERETVSPILTSAMMWSETVLTTLLVCTINRYEMIVANFEIIP